MKCNSYAAMAEGKPLEHYEFERREPLPDDVEVSIKYSGICHSDIHTARGDWGEANYPCVPGHEIVGEVTRVGDNVSEFSPGDVVGVGVYVNSCRECDACNSRYSNYCEKGITLTYNATDPIDGSITAGGYSDLIVVQKQYVNTIPDGLDPEAAAPLLCAGITMYSPLRNWEAGPGKKIGIVGLGGLGHIGVKLAKAMGAETWVITSSPEKATAAESYGADGVIVSSDEEQMAAGYRQFDLLVSTVPVEHDPSPYLELLAINGTLCFVGAINPMPGYHGGQLIGGRKSLAGSGIGSVEECQEMLEFCAANNIVCDIESIEMDSVNEAWDRVASGDMDKRFVIDVSKSF